MIIFILCCIIQRLFRGVAQFGSALGSGPRGRGFKSRHLDQKKSDVFCVALFLRLICADTPNGYAILPLSRKRESLGKNLLRKLTSEAHCATLQIHTAPAKNKSTPKIGVLLLLAGETRFEHATYGFGDRYSTVEPLP